MYHFLALSLAPLLYPNTVHAIQRGCDVRNAKLELPAGQTELVLEPDIYPVSIAQGLGTQNYTCSSSGTYTYDQLLPVLHLRSHVMTGPLALSPRCTTFHASSLKPFPRVSPTRSSAAPIGSGMPIMMISSMTIFALAATTLFRTPSIHTM